MQEAAIDEQARTPESIPGLPSIQSLPLFPFEWRDITSLGSQVLALRLIVTLVFGAWAIKSYNAAQQANALSNMSLQQTLLANRLTLLSLCTVPEGVQPDPACAVVSQAFDLQEILNSLGLPGTTQIYSTAPPLPSTTTSETSTQISVSLPATTSATTTSLPPPPPPATTSLLPPPPPTTSLPPPPPPTTAATTTRSTVNPPTPSTTPPAGQTPKNSPPITSFASVVGIIVAVVLGSAIALLISVSIIHRRSSRKRGITVV